MKFVTSGSLARHRKIHLNPSRRRGRHSKDKKNAVAVVEPPGGQQQLPSSENVVTLRQLQLVVAEEVMNGGIKTMTLKSV